MKYNILETIFLVCISCIVQMWHFHTCFYDDNKKLLACILSNPCTNDFLKKQNVVENETIDEEKKDSEELQIQSGCAHALTNSDDDQAQIRNPLACTVSSHSCYCGQEESAHTLTWVQCSQCKQTMHGICAGFTSKTNLFENTSIGYPRICDKSHCPFCEFKAGLCERIGSRATLIVTPPSILNQWIREIKRHTSIKKDDQDSIGESLKVRVYPGVKEICSTSHVKAAQTNCMKMLLPQYLADSDGKAVILSFSFYLTFPITLITHH